MSAFTASEAARHFGALLDAAEDGPVTITKFGRPWAVVVSTRLFEFYDEAEERARTERCLELLMRGIDFLKAGELGRGQRAVALARRLRFGAERPVDERAINELLKIIDG